MNISFEIHELNDELREAYATLLENQRSAIEDGMLEWKLERGSAGAAKIVCARAGKEIIGISTNLPTNYKLGNVQGLAFQAIDSIVSSSARGKGVFTRLAHHFEAVQQNSDCDLIWGFPNADAAPAWFGKMKWIRHGYVPFMVKPLRAGYFSRRLGLSADFSLSRLQNHNVPPCQPASWLDSLWDEFSRGLKCAVQRNRAYLEWRLFGVPDRTYRVAALPDDTGGALVASRLVPKHGGRIGYLMEAMGGSRLKGLVASEIGWLREEGAELVLAWCFPWSPNYRTFRDLGFLPLPNAFRPIEMHFGSKSLSARGSVSNDAKNWYLSYLDSDTV